MCFNEIITIKNALNDHFVGKPVTSQTGMVVQEDAEYMACNKDLKWRYVHGENLVLYGKQPHYVIGNSTFININQCEVNYV